MTKKELHISAIQVNSNNPREITEAMFDKLIVSLLTFPRMLLLREIVVDRENIILAGNMRYRALYAISTMQIGELKRLIDTSHKAKKFPDEWKESLFKYWVEWQKYPMIVVKDASELSEEEQREFLIKDNVSYGEFEQDMLANEWDMDDIDDWGVYTWVDNDSVEDSEQVDKPMRYFVEVDCKNRKEQEELVDLVESRGYKIKKKGGE